MFADVCVKCGEDVRGTLEGVTLTICCVRCAAKSKNSEEEPCRFREEHCIPKSHAWSKTTTPWRLCLLGYKTRGTPKGRGRRKGKLLVRAEVEVIGAAPLWTTCRGGWGRLARICRERERLENEFGFSLRALDARVRCFLFKEYVNRNSKSPALWEDLRRRCTVVNRVQEILKACDRAHPEAAFQFCLDYPTAGFSEFQEMKAKIRKVLSTEGVRILRMLPTGDAKELRKTVLNDVYVEFKKRNKADRVRGHPFLATDERTPKGIASCPFRRERSKRGREEDAVVARTMLKLQQAVDEHTRPGKELKRAFEEKRIRCTEPSLPERHLDAMELLTPAEMARNRESLFHVYGGSQAGRWYGQASMDGRLLDFFLWIKCMHLEDEVFVEDPDGRRPFKITDCFESRV